MEKTMRVVIDARPIDVEKGQTILEAARLLGIRIPTLCFHPYLAPVGSCRLCVVDIAGERGLAASCTTPVQNGMVVQTQTPRVREYRREMLQTILQDYPGDCAVCPRDQNCELQDVIQEVGLDLPAGKASESARQKLPGGPFFERDYNFCIRCGRCVRVCHEIRGAQAIVFRDVNGRQEVSTPFQRRLEESGCQFCGACVDVCPSGALQQRFDQHALQPHGEVREVTSICPYCGVGCRFIFEVQDGRILRTRPDPSGPANRGQACVKGRFGIADFVHHPDRLTHPLVMSDGSWKTATWDEAADLAAERLSLYEPNEVAVVACARATNEDNYVLQKFTRAVLQTNSIDCCARI
jgi:predicted molibdopterin-dependent oxidoreductase YjgC